MRYLSHVDISQCNLVAANANTAVCVTRQGHLLVYPVKSFAAKGAYYKIQSLSDSSFASDFGAGLVPKSNSLSTTLQPQASKTRAIQSHPLPTSSQDDNPLLSCPSTKGSLVADVKELSGLGGKELSKHVMFWDPRVFAIRRGEISLNLMIAACRDG